MWDSSEAGRCNWDSSIEGGMTASVNGGIHTCRLNTVILVTNHSVCSINGK